MVGKNMNAILRFAVTMALAGTLLSSLAYTPVASAQTAPAAPVNEQKTRAGGPRKQLATIIFAGLGGAVLGLSTLSFYGRPQDYLVNLPIGFGVGVIAGTVFVTYRAITNPNELYGDGKTPAQDPRGMNELALEHTNAHGIMASGRPLGFNYDWQF